MGCRGEIRAGGPTFQSHRPPLSHRDRKKKRFVGQTGQEDKKKVRTESGRYISSSYKNNLYPACGRCCLLVPGRGLGARGSGAGPAGSRPASCPAPGDRSRTRADTVVG